MTELAAQLLESPKAPQIIQQVQAILNDEKQHRQAFYEWVKAIFDATATVAALCTILMAH